MGSILIKNLSFPTTCLSCPFYAYSAPDDFSCILQLDFSSCPLSEIKTPHGRLIDADALISALNNKAEDNKKWYGFPETLNLCLNFREAIDVINQMPTIIDAEGDIQ